MPATSQVAKKLRLLPGFRAALVNAPAYLQRLEPLPERVQIVEGASTGLDFVQVFAADVAELRRFGPDAIQSVKRDGLLWVTYPRGGVTKGVTDLPASPWWRRRDVLGEITGRRGYVAVALASIDETWTALSFRPVPGAR
jgi:hypothetical protein